VTPGFSADCLETLEEIAMRGRDTFLAGGGEAFAYLPCLNAQADAIALYARLLGRELAGWIGGWARPATSSLGRRGMI